MTTTHMNGPSSPLLVVWIVAAVALVAILLILMNWKQRDERAGRTFLALCSQLGLSPSDKGVCSVKYFREYPFIGFGRKLLLAAGTLDGIHVELCVVPYMRSCPKGQTMVGIQCPTVAGVEVGLTRRDVIISTIGSVMGLSNRSGDGPLSGKYDTWGTDVARVLTSEVQTSVRSFPGSIDKLWVSGHDAVIVWDGVELEAAVIAYAFRLGMSLHEAATAR